MIDEILRSEGARWRAAQPPPPPPRIAVGAPARGPRWSRWAPVAVVAAVIAVLAVVALPLALRTGSAPTAPGWAPAIGDRFATLPPDTGAGIKVVGIGLLVRDEAGTIRLCRTLASSTGTDIGCGAPAVIVTGVPREWLSHPSASGRQAYSDLVGVDGTYHNGVLAAASVGHSVEASIVPTSPSHPSPCASPAGGWPTGYGPAGGDAAGLTAYVRAHPDRFTDVWTAEPDGLGGPSAQPISTVYAVGTTGNVAQARSELAALYGGNLCVYAAAYPAAELDRIANQLRATSATAITAEADAEADAVRVDVVAYDAHTASVIEEIGGSAVILDGVLLLGIEERSSGSTIQTTLESPHE